MAELNNPFKIPPKPGTTNKRLSLSKNLDRMMEMPMDQRMEFVVALAKLADEAKGFRHHAPSTQNRQDAHLASYTDFLVYLCKSKTPEDYSDQELEELRFPADFQRLYTQLRMFLMYVFLNTSPRSRATGERISYRSLASYRDSIIFWLYSHYRRRNIIPPPKAEVYHQVTEAMRAVYEKYEGKLSIPHKKTWLGLGELRQLFDYEMLHNRCIENSEQHQAAWAIARMTSCRAGSLCISGKYGRAAPLQWRNLEFTRGDAPGKFICTITFDNILIKRPNDPEQSLRPHPDHRLEVVLGCPEPSNIIFSAAHRLLVIALRRNLLQDVNNLDELLVHQGRYIFIKKDHLNDPIFYRSTPKGTAVDTTKPMSADTLTSYLSSRGVLLGYADGISMHSIRRRAATDMVALIGPEATRRMMGHAPESFTLEQYYMNMAQLAAATGLSLVQPDQPTKAYSTELIEKWSPLALGRLDNEQARMTRGLALQAMTTKLILADPKPPSATAAGNEIKQYRKRMRRCAQKALIEEQHALAKSALSSADFDKRQAELKSSGFAKRVLERALELSQDSGQAETSADSVGDDLFVDEYQDAEQDLEQLAEQMLQGGTNRRIEVCLDGEVEIEAQTNQAVREADYVAVARSFMSILLDNSLTTYKTWSDREQTCPECFGDETTSETDKAKKYNSEQHLLKHMTSVFHSPIGKWRRAAHIRALQQPEGKYVCEYCIQSGKAENATKHARITELSHHIQSSTAEDDGEQHDMLKAEAGWYSEDFMPPPSEYRIRERKRAGAQELRKVGINLVHQRQIIGTEPDPAFDGVVRGSSDKPMPARFTNALTTQRLPPPSFRQQEALQRGGHINIPDDFRNALVNTSQSSASLQTHSPVHDPALYGPFQNMNNSPLEKTFRHSGGAIVIDSDSENDDGDDRNAQDGEGFDPMDEDEVEEQDDEHDVDEMEL